MKAVTIELAELLIPNPAHKSFSGSNTFLNAGQEIEGEPTVVEGNRRGRPFSYKLFKTNDNKYIFLNKIKIDDMKTTDVKLGADGQTTPTVINTRAHFKYAPALGALTGAFIAWRYSKKHQHTTAKMAMWIGVAGLAGYGVGKFIVNQDGLGITKSK